MPRTCLACKSPNREAIDKALANGTPLRDIEGQWDISRSALDRHKSHVATGLVKAGERREERLGDNIFDEMRRVLANAWELTDIAKAAGDHRGAMVGNGEVRKCLESLDALLAKAQGSGPAEVRVEIVHIGGGE